MQMKLLAIGPFTLAILWTCASLTCGQSIPSNTTEFITSSSPLPDGSIVTTTFVPRSGGDPQTKWTPAGTSIRGSWGTPTQSAEQSVLRPGSQSSVLSGSSQPILTTAQLPSTSAPTFVPQTAAPVQMSTWGNPYTGPRPYLAPTNPWSYRVCGYPQTPTAVLPTGTVYPYPVASTPPTLNTLPPASLPPTLQPTVPSSVPVRTTYRPAIQFRNLTPGTYLGQGLIGQPKAYVDGQPIRNLFRYIFP
jgi:hypothetical protein